jgi:dCTP diphosphatase
MRQTLSDLTDIVLSFRAKRDWAQFHTPKELAISLVVEAAELLELMQWKQGRQLADQLRKKHTAIADELADCLHSILLLAHDMKIDLGAAFEAKMAKTGRKYPVSKARGKPHKYTELKRMQNAE